MNKVRLHEMLRFSGSFLSPGSDYTDLANDAIITMAPRLCYRSIRKVKIGEFHKELTLNRQDDLHINETKVTRYGLVSFRQKNRGSVLKSDYCAIKFQICIATVQ